MVMGMIPINYNCKICDKIDVKMRRRTAQVERISRWQRENGNDGMYPLTGIAAHRSQTSQERLSRTPIVNVRKRPESIAGAAIPQIRVQKVNGDLPESIRDDSATSHTDSTRNDVNRSTNLKRKEPHESNGTAPPLDISRSMTLKRSDVGAVPSNVNRKDVGTILQGISAREMAGKGSMPYQPQSKRQKQFSFMHQSKNILPGPIMESASKLTRPKICMKNTIAEDCSNQTLIRRKLLTCIMAQHKNSKHGASERASTPSQGSTISKHNPKRDSHVHTSSSRQVPAPKTGQTIHTQPQTRRPGANAKSFKYSIAKAMDYIRQLDGEIYELSCKRTSRLQAIGH